MSDDVSMNMVSIKLQKCSPWCLFIYCLYRIYFPHIFDEIKLVAGAYLQGPCTWPPLADPNFYWCTGIFGHFTTFCSSRTSKFRHSLTKKLQLRPPDPLPGLFPWTSLGTSVPRPSRPPFYTFWIRHWLITHVDISTVPNELVSINTIGEFNVDSKAEYSALYSKVQKYSHDVSSCIVCTEFAFMTFFDEINFVQFQWWNCCEIFHRLVLSYTVM